ncbi:MAG: hypothetical protein QOJ94_1721 [Sphingomonadales bacterium]|jgi:hypothetical protein|nr:hypothetical protein [Sphingomonadales bacterium]
MGDKVTRRRLRYLNATLTGTLAGQAAASRRMINDVMISSDRTITPILRPQPMPAIRSPCDTPGMPHAQC